MSADLRAQFIRFCLGAGILSFGEFTTKAGRVSPYFFNAGMFNDGLLLGKLGNFYAETLLAAERTPTSITGRLGSLFEMPTGLGTLDAGAVFAPPEGEIEADMTEWITFARADEADHDSGLVFLEKPLEGSR